MTENLRAILRCTGVTVLVIAGLLTAPIASAHTDPPGATATGVSLSLTALRADGVTPVRPGNVNQCETIIFRAVLAYNTNTSGGINAAFEGGTLTITDPSGTVHDVTPVGGIPCIGGDDLAEGCDPSVDSVMSETVTYVANVASCPATLVATVTYANGTAHINGGQSGIGGTNPFPVDVTCCAQDGLHCNGAEFCDPNLIIDPDPSTPLTFRKGGCADGPDVVCNSDNNLCNGPEVCNEATDSCASAGPVVDCTGAFFCSTESCNPATGQCVAGTPDVNCSDNDVCTDDTCDEASNTCVNTPNPGNDPSCQQTGCGLLLIDEDSIDNGLPPNFFDNITNCGASGCDVNDHIARIGLRTELPYFAAHEGDIITLWTGTVGDEGWFTLEQIPQKWNTGGQQNGLANFLAAANGLGSGKNPEKFLDKIPHVNPLRATGLEMLENSNACICAVVWDSDISINYDNPINGSLKGANLGIVAFNVLDVSKMNPPQSSGSLPMVQIEILDADQYCNLPLTLFDAPTLRSSSEPYDVDPDP